MACSFTFPLCDATKRQPSWKNFLIEDSKGNNFGEELFNFDFFPSSFSIDSVLKEDKNQPFFKVEPIFNSAVSNNTNNNINNNKKHKLANDPLLRSPPNSGESDIESLNDEGDLGGDTLLMKPTPLFFRMDRFSEDKVTDLKHVIYNLLVDGYNSENPRNGVIFPCSLMVDGKVRNGFQFNNEMDPEKRIPELYGNHIHQSKLELENQDSPFIQDIYKFYLRAGVELLGKYFEKVGKYTFLYDEELPLFIPGGSLKEAESRIKRMKTRSRKRDSREVAMDSVEGPFKKKRASSRKIPYYVKCGITL